MLIAEIGHVAVTSVDVPSSGLPPLWVTRVESSAQIAAVSPDRVLSTFQEPNQPRRSSFPVRRSPPRVIDEHVRAASIPPKSANLSPQPPEKAGLGLHARGGDLVERLHLQDGGAACFYWCTVIPIAESSLDTSTWTASRARFGAVSAIYRNERPSVVMWKRRGSLSPRHSPRIEMMWRPRCSVQGKAVSWIASQRSRNSRACSRFHSS